MTNNNIFDYWAMPEFTPRENQIKALEWFEQQTAKYVILEAPVGSGKSISAVTYSRYLSQSDTGNSFILTPQLILQKQYERDFESQGKSFLSTLYGKNNYKCAKSHASCGIGSILKAKCQYCPYRSAKQKAISTGNTVLNYKLAFTNFEYTDTFSKRKLLVMDEAHTLEKHLVDFDACSITYMRCEQYGINFKVQRDIKTAIKWIKSNYLPKISSKLNELQADCEYIYEIPGSKITKKEINQLKEIDELTSHVDDITEMASRSVEYLKEHFVLVTDKTLFQFKRLTGAYSFKKIIEPRAERFLFMSSTILNKDAFCAELGIDEKNMAFLSLDSDFPVKNRPIYYMPMHKMNASWNKPENKFDKDQMLTRIMALLDLHKDESGILHTGNYQVAIWLVDELQKLTNHAVYHHNPDTDINRNEAVEHFLDCSSPSILISPSCTEGLDLKDDLARFAMIVKTPFGYLGDNWIKTRMGLSKEWYQRRAMIDIIQGSGRVVRSAEDEGTVYILDGSFGYLYSQTVNIVPQWWKDAFSRI